MSNSYGIGGTSGGGPYYVVVNGTRLHNQFETLALALAYVDRAKVEDAWAEAGGWTGYTPKAKAYELRTRATCPACISLKPTVPS